MKTLRSHQPLRLRRTLDFDQNLGVKPGKNKRTGKAVPPQG
jgi:hypothetical protein